jgi:hypothetical protein
MSGPLEFRCFAAGSLVLAALFWQATPVSGQDAYLSALSLNSAINPAPEGSAFFRPLAVRHLGPVDFGLGAALGAGYNDNVNESSLAQQTDTFVQGSVDVYFSWTATARSKLNLGADVGYNYYFNHTEVGGLSVQPNSVLDYTIDIPDGTLDLFDQFNYTRQVTSEGALANLADLARFENNVGALATWNPGEWNLQVMCSYDSFRPSSRNDYLNRDSEYFYGKAAWRFSRSSETGLEGSGGLTSYKVSGLNDYYSVSVGPFVDWQARPFLHLGLRGGFTSFVFSGQGGGSGYTLNSYYITLDATHDLTAYLHHELALQRSLQAGLNAGSDYIEQWTATYSASWQATQRLAVRGSVTYENGLQPFQAESFFGFPATVQENFSLIGFGGQFSWQFWRKLSASLSYNHWVRTSSIGTQDYFPPSFTSARGFSQNIVSVNLNYSF